MLAAFFNRALHSFGDSTEAVDKLDQADIGGDFKDEVV